ncbi:MAG TPA: LysM peptidoglycan-binding domain-containing protein [Candidatus Acidoferrum sp.]|nr:LysM peptidoglycan-binding domain-containing protein [Candidatus Acidoferrum sp.]
MQRTDLDMPLLTIPLSHERTSSRFVRLTCSGILIISCTIFGYSQCYAQDVADAARQEQARKQNQQKKSKHVYTDEDLKRAQILTPEDRAEVEARKAQQPPPGMDNSQDPLDAETLPLDAPLGDVARRYRRLRELQRLQQSAEFHLPFTEEQVHATPKPSVLIPIEAPVLVSPKPPVTRTVILIPAPPPRVEPFQPPVKRSPFERPRVFLSAPARIAPLQPSANHGAVAEASSVSAAPAGPSTILVAPAKPAAPPPVVHLMPPNRTATRVPTAEPAAPAVGTTPAQVGALPVVPSKPPAPVRDFGVAPPTAHAAHLAPAQPKAPVVGALPSHATIPTVRPAEPAVPKPDFSVMPSPAAAVRVAPAKPAAPAVRAVPSGASIPTLTPAEPVAPKPDLSAMPSPVRTPRVSPTQPIAPGIAATPSKPSVLGVNPSQPASPVVPVAPPRVTAPSRTAPAGPAKLNVLTVQPGDSLWKLAQQNLGEGVRWPELLAANPAIVDPNHIVAGSHIFLPSIASRFRTATSIIVQKGDTLSEIARMQLGHASYWSCIAHANPVIRDANLIYEGQTLFVPASCKQ